MIQSSTNKGYVRERLSTLAQRDAGLQTLAVSEGQSHFCVQGCHLNRGKALQVSACAARSLSLSSGLNLWRNHAHTDMHDRRPCQRISCLQAPAHTAGGQSGSSASACLRRFSLCFTLPGLVNMQARPPAPSAGPSGTPPICSLDNEVCELFL